MCSSRTNNFAPVSHPSGPPGPTPPMPSSSAISRFTCHVSRFTHHATRKTQHASAFAAVLLLSAVSALAQPANDNFANAEVLPGPSGFIQRNNDNATLEVGEPV